MTPSGESRQRAVWKAALAPSAACIPIEKFAEPLSPVATRHLEGCPRCQAEMALWQEFDESAPAAGEGAAVAWIAQELGRRSSLAEVRPAGWWRRWMAAPVYRLSGALAAILLLAGGLTVYSLRNRTGGGDGQGGEGVLRSQSITLVSPVGDLEARPEELTWQQVPTATTYNVEIMEVDRHSLWKSQTPQTHLTIPANIRSLISPGKTLLWQVTAASTSQSALATSELQKFKVKVKKNVGGEL